MYARNQIRSDEFNYNRDRFRLSKKGRKIFEREFSPTNEKAAGGSGGPLSPPKALGFQTL